MWPTAACPEYVVKHSITRAQHLNMCNVQCGHRNGWRVVVGTFMSAHTYGPKVILPCDIYVCVYLRGLLDHYSILLLYYCIFILLYFHILILFYSIYRCDCTITSQSVILLIYFCHMHIGTGVCTTPQVIDPHGPRVSKDWVRVPKHCSPPKPYRTTVVGRCTSGLAFASHLKSLTHMTKAAVRIGRVVPLSSALSSGMAEGEWADHSWNAANLAKVSQMSWWTSSEFMTIVGANHHFDEHPDSAPHTAPHCSHHDVGAMYYPS